MLARYKDSLHIYLDPKLTAQVATTSFELDVSHTAVPPLDALILPELRATMLAVGAELRFLGVLSAKYSNNKKCRRTTALETTDSPMAVN